MEDPEMWMERLADPLPGEARQVEVDEDQEARDFARLSAMRQ